MRRCLFVMPLICLLAACGDTVSDAPADGARKAVESVIAKAPPAPTELQPGQSVQGLIEADVGQGMQVFRSLTTKMADDLDKQFDEKLAGREGQRALDEANRTLKDSGIKQEVKADQVRDLVSGLAGKTFHDSSIHIIDMIGTLDVSLSGAAADGSKATVFLRFGIDDLAFREGSVSYQPVARDMFDRYETTKEAPPSMVVERFEKNADGSYALAGSFRATDLPPIRMAKKLTQPLPSIEGRFAFESLPARELKIGGK